MNAWRSRLVVGLIFWLSMKVHMETTTGLPNNPQGMLWFHGSAAAVDMILLYCVPKLLSGRLCDDMQMMCLASIVVNSLGWLAYLAYAPPIFYNTVMWGLSYVQWARLLLMDRHDSDRFFGLDMVCGSDCRSYQFNLGKTHT